MAKKKKTLWYVNFNRQPLNDINKMELKDTLSYSWQIICSLSWIKVFTILRFWHQSGANKGLFINTGKCFVSLWIMYWLAVGTSILTYSLIIHSSSISCSPTHSIWNNYIKGHFGFQISLDGLISYGLLIICFSSIFCYRLFL